MQIPKRRRGCVLITCRHLFRTMRYMIIIRQYCAQVFHSLQCYTFTKILTYTRKSSKTTVRYLISALSRKLWRRWFRQSVDHGKTGEKHIKNMLLPVAKYRQDSQIHHWRCLSDACTGFNHLTLGLRQCTESHKPYFIDYSVCKVVLLALFQGPISTVILLPF